MDDICSLDIRGLAQKLGKRELSASEAVRACLDRIAATEDKIQALLHVDGEGALNYAKTLDEAGPDSSRPLWGVPIILKDALSTKDMPTTAASKILENFRPFYDAFVVEKLRAAGAIILGKANMDEFAMGSSTENSAFKITRNPWNLNRVPGGSSGGSAASTAARQCFASLGSDTGGSIRQPAGFCGCVGLKPTYGRVSRYGLFAFASSLDQIGPITRTVADCALMLDVIAGHDPRDSTSVDRPCGNYSAALENTAADKPLAGTRIGFPADFFGTGVSAEIRECCGAAIELAKNLGAEIIDIKPPSPDVASAVYYIVAMAEASSNLARYDGVRYGARAPGVSSLADLYLKSRSQGFGREVKRRVMLGSFVLSSGYYDAYFKKAAQTRRLIYDQYVKIFEQCDIICLPVAPSTAWRLNSHKEDPLRAYLMDAFTLPVNLAGLPGLSLPVGLGRETGMPVGMQLVGGHFDEAGILRRAHILESALPKIGEPPLKAL